MIPVSLLTVDGVNPGYPSYNPAVDCYSISIKLQGTRESKSMYLLDKCGSELGAA